MYVGNKAIAMLPWQQVLNKSRHSHMTGSTFLDGFVHVLTGWIANMPKGKANVKSYTP